MKKSFLVLLFAVINAFAQDVSFPRQLIHEGSILTMYQPQVENWENYTKLNFRMAFSLVPKQGKEVLGVLYMISDTYVNKESNTVFISNMVVNKTHFPSLDEAASQKMDALVRKFVSPEKSLVMSLNQVVASTPKKGAITNVTVINTPPVIFNSTTSAVLLQIDGAPVKASSGQPNLQYIVNASFPLFEDTNSKTFYLFDGLEWQSSKDLKKGWAFTKTLPTSLLTLANDASWLNLKGSVPVADKPNKKIPTIFYSEKLAQLILFEGKPAFTPITGTSLKFANNTDSDLFFSTSNNAYYYLAAGRWFSASKLDGQWEYSSSTLPADFLKIPADSPASSVMAFVPGTDQAADAVMIAQIPTTVEVSPTAAQNINITYSGLPKFEPIENTTLLYAVNTADKVIEVNATQYYACVGGVWFVATTANGPWQTATTIPASIYTIPSSSPVYNVTYVTQNVTNTGAVQATYTSGYMGVYIVGMATAAIIISGTGYYHPPYYYYPPYGYPIYYPHPCTYGPYAYHAYPYGGVAYHASYNPNTGAYGRSVTAYGPYGSATRAQAYNPSTGTMARGASVSNGYGTTSAAQAYNPYTGKSASTIQNSNAYGHSGSSTFNNGQGKTTQTSHTTTARGTTASIKNSSGGAAIGASGANNSGAIGKTASGNMFASANGNVYKNTGSGWEEAGGSNTPNPTTSNTNKSQGVQKPTTTSQSFNTQDMNKAATDRQRGNTQTQQFQGRNSSGQNSFSGSGRNSSGGRSSSGGGRSGGGGRR